MPHFVVEYSANLEERIDIQGLCNLIREAAMKAGVFELGAIRVRAYPAKHYSIADLDARNAFVHLQLRVGAGRPVDVLREAGNEIFEALRSALGDELAHPYFALSFEFVEIHPQLTWKANSLHNRLRKH